MCRYLVGGVVRQFTFHLCPGGNPRSGFSGSDDGEVPASSPAWVITFGVVHRLEGQVVGLVAGPRSPYASHVVTKAERHAIYSIDDSESWWEGAAVGNMP